MEYRVGDTIEYRAFSGELRRVRVTAKHANIKNGRAGFDAELPNGQGGGVSVWGYDSQIVRVAHNVPVGAPKQTTVVVPRVCACEAWPFCAHAPNAVPLPTQDANVPHQGEPGLEPSKGDSIGQ